MATWCFPTILYGPGVVWFDRAQSRFALPLQPGITLKKVCKKYQWKNTTSDQRRSARAVCMKINNNTPTFRNSSQPTSYPGLFDTGFTVPESPSTPTRAPDPALTLAERFLGKHSHRLTHTVVVTWWPALNSHGAKTVFLFQHACCVVKMSLLGM